MEIRNVFSLKEISFQKGEEYFEPLCQHGDLKIERIISQGQVSPPDFWYQQEKDEWVVLLKGMATLEFENNRMLHFKAGDSLHIPAGIRHRVTYTSKEPACVWIGVHFK